jgi:hypothetical protein
MARDFACGPSSQHARGRIVTPNAPDAHTHGKAQLNKTFCYLFTQTGSLFEMIIHTYLS